MDLTAWQMRKEEHAAHVLRSMWQLSHDTCTNEGHNDVLESLWQNVQQRAERYQSEGNLGRSMAAQG